MRSEPDPGGRVAGAIRRAVRFRSLAEPNLENRALVDGVLRSPQACQEYELCL
ncbi:hypothetical protein [Streptomyces pratensis]|uniref:hypothetical protein n=1 Tax=Streptomyces pratensis TaxID=1169025 RepID=UPI0019313977|nr:hypothetical protein [Streptomyces pratensis]